jgi:hypothetical protein
LPQQIAENQQPDRASTALRKRAESAERALGEYRRAMVILANCRSSPDARPSPFEHLARGEKRRGILEKT